MTQNTQPGYGFGQDTPEQLGAAPIPAGINEKIALMKVAYEPAKPGSTNMGLAFHFKNKKGQQLRHMEWPIDVEETKTRAAKANDDPEKAVQKKFQAQAVRIKHIVTKVIPPQQAEVKGVTTFEQYAHAVAKLVQPHLPVGPFWLKVLLKDNNDFSTLPPYTPFIEKQEADKPTSLRIGPDEKVVPSGQGGGAKGNLEMPDELPGEEDAAPPPPDTGTKPSHLEVPDDIDDDMPF